MFNFRQVTTKLEERVQKLQPVLYTILSSKVIRVDSNLSKVCI